MSSSKIEESLPSWEDVAEEAQRALKKRPSISIRVRLMLGFLAWLVLSLGLAVFSMVNISSITVKLHFLESAQNYMFEIQQARRFEKNFFLYHTNIDDALEHVHNARELLKNSSQEMGKVIGKANYDTMKRHLKQYEDLLLEIKNIVAENADTALKFEPIELELRQFGAEMVIVGNQILTKEREQVNSMLALSHKIPLIFLALLILLILSLSYFIATQMLAPLNRIVQATTLIAEGDLTPITPRRRYNDEFSRLAMALNHMMLQLLRRQEQLAQVHKVKAVGTLTAGVAHDLNNPLNNIMLTSSALLEEYKELSDEEFEDMINDLLSESERAQIIVRKLLDFARQSEIGSEAIQIEEIIDQTLQLVGNQIKLAGIKVKGEISSDLPPIHGDRRQLVQVFLNIILNAIDAMPNGGTLNISLHNTQDREYVAADLSDTGVGIPDHKLANIFDPFYTTKREGKGTGLGLSVSLGIVQKHGGEIKVSSKLKNGTTFSVLLPAAKIPASISKSSS